MVLKLFLFKYVLAKLLDQLAVSLLMALNRCFQACDLFNECQIVSFLVVQLRLE